MMAVIGIVAWGICSERVVTGSSSTGDAQRD